MPSKKISVLIADDHRLFAEALEAILASEPEIEVVGRARNGEEAVEQALALSPDVILMHSGRDTGFGGMGFTPASQGGTHIVERNLTRLTIAVAILFTANTVLLFHLLQ